MRLATPEAVVNLLQNHCQLEDAKYFVVTDLREVASGSLRITLNELISRVPTGLRCERGHSASAQLRRLNPSPVTQRQAQIGQWIANRRHLPIEHRLDALGRVFAEHNVIQLVIVMHQGRRGRRRSVIDEPSNHAIHLRHVIRCGPFPTISPTLHLAFKKSFRLTEGNQTGPGNIDGVQAY